MGAPTSSQADIRLYKVVHKAFRLATTRMVDASAKLEPSALEPVIGPYWTFYSGILNHHHQSEDDSVFPALLAVRPDLTELADSLEDDHRGLVRTLENVDSSIAAFGKQADASHQEAVREAVTGLRDVFFPHLDVEDAKILPAIAQSIPPKEWDRLDQASLRSIPRQLVGRAVGALDEIIQGLGEQEQPLPPPPPIRLMLALTWRKKWSAFVKPLAC